MAWQDMIFLMGSLLSVGFLIPTIRNAGACVPWATSVPSVVIGFVYALTFLSLGMDFSAFGSMAAGMMWSLIVYFRGPGIDSLDRCILPDTIREYNAVNSAE